LIAEPYNIEGACALIPTWNSRPRRVGDLDCQIRDEVVVGVDRIARELRHEAVLRCRFHHGIGRNGNSFKQLRERQGSIRPRSTVCDVTRRSDLDDIRARKQLVPIKGMDDAIG
jgi:hypothetical protein